jgi:hypothetical protein
MIMWKVDFSIECSVGKKKQLSTSGRAPEEAQAAAKNPTASCAEPRPFFLDLLRFFLSWSSFFLPFFSAFFLFEPLPFEEFEECDLDLSSLAGIADLRL